MKGYALSSAVPEFPITAAIATALLANLRRLETHWRDVLLTLDTWERLENVVLEWSEDIGAVPADPELAVVQVVRELPPDSPPDAIAYHTVDAAGRPLCLIGYARVLAEKGATPLGPDGVVAAISHEIGESRVDPDCTATVPLPGANTTGDLSTPREVYDWTQGTDYVEPGCDGIYVANAVTPRFFEQGAKGDGLDIRGDVTTPAVTEAYQETPDGYHEVLAPNAPPSFVFGEKVPEARRARLNLSGPRGGKVRARRAHLDYP